MMVLHVHAGALDRPETKSSKRDAGVREPWRSSLSEKPRKVRYSYSGGVGGGMGCLFGARGCVVVIVR